MTLNIEELKEQLYKLYDNNTREDCIHKIIQLINNDIIKLKKKRNKTEIPISERCIARRNDNGQCTRRKKDGNMFCGTHIKNKPNGIIDNIETTNNNKTKVEVRVETYKGITYYLDNYGNVYHPIDIINNIINPRIIGTYTRNIDENNIDLTLDV